MGNRNNPTRGTASESRYSLMEFMAEFPDDDACLTYLWRSRHSPDGEHALCPRCQIERTFHRYHTAQQRQSWTCSACGLHVHPTAGTIFHKSSTSLHLWFYALYLITSTRCGISAKQLERELGVTYKTAWRMFNVIRNSLMAENGITLSGTVEMDETYLTPRRRRDEPTWHSGHNPRERVVMGAVQRQGKVVARYVPSANGLAVEYMTEAHVLPASMIYTDTARIYRRLPGRGYGHERVNHSAGIYVSGDVHTQTIEGFWALLKSGIRGTYHSVSTKWLQSYLDEYAWRYNHREFTRRQSGVRRVPVGEAKFRLLLGLACRPTA
ncbi:MAG: IS1595 family transposase [Candidatus Dormibacteria bacterium]|jgi:transposase